MLVHINSQFRDLTDLYDLEYELVYNDSTTVQAIIQDFAKRFSLEANHCTASHWEHGHKRHTKLTGHEVLLQVAGHRQKVTLSMDFSVSIAFYVWQSFRKGIWQSRGQSTDVKEVWRIAAEVCSTHGCIAASIANSSAFLPALLMVDPLQTLAVDMTQQLKTTTLSNPCKLPQVKPPSQALLLFIQLLNVVAAECNSVTATSTAGTNQLHSAIASKLQQLTNNSRCTLVLSTDPTVQDQAGAPQPLAEPSKRVLLLRSAVLLLKLATLTFNVKADFLHAQQVSFSSGFDFELPRAVRSLWFTMTPLAVAIIETRTDPSDATTWHRDFALEEDQLAAALFEHLVLALRQGVKKPSVKVMAEMPHTLACLRLLAAVVTIMHPKIVRYEVKRLGALPLVAAFLDLDQGWAGGHAALQIVDILCSPAVDLDGQHADLLARLHAVRRLSDVLCSIQPFKEHMMAAGPGARSISAKALQRALAEAADSCSLAGNVRRAWTAVSLMITSLHLHPLSQRLSAGVSAGKATLTGQDAKTGLPGTASTASTRAATSRQPEKWPTPKANEWQDVELIALRAFTTLDWAVSTVSATHTSGEDTSSLVARLCQLLLYLVAGHLPDLDLDMQRLFDVGLQPVLDAQLKGHAEFEGLAAMMLSRLATDSRLMLQGQKCARQICHIFGNRCRKEPCVVSNNRLVVSPPSALLIATARLLHLVVARLEDEGNLPAWLTTAIDGAMSAFFDRLIDKMMLCACLGALTVEREVLNGRFCNSAVSKFPFKGSYDAVFTTLEQVMQAPTPWDEELCLATATMMYRCGNAVLLQAPSGDPRCEGMQTLLVQLLQQLQRSRITADQVLQRLLLHSCCKCLQHCLGLATTDHSAVVPALTHWISALVEAVWEPIVAGFHPIFQIIGLPMLANARLLESLLCMVTAYLDCQQKWHDYAQNGLSSFLVALEKSCDGQWALVQWMHILSKASKCHALPAASLAIDREVAVAHDTNANQDQAEANNVLILLWRRVGCVAVLLLSDRCGQACRLHEAHQNMLQEQVALKLLQRKHSDAKNEVALTLLEAKLSQLMTQLQEVQKQLDTVVPALYGLQQEPAWPCIMDAHQPDNWPNSMPPAPTDRYHDLLYLHRQDSLSMETTQAISSFYNFMLREGRDARQQKQRKAEEASAAAAAEELIAEEAREAAQAAAKKAKKKKAKARKQQARSDATPASSPAASEAAAGLSLQAQQDVGAMATLEQGSPSGTRGCEMPPDQDAAGLQVQLQHMTAPDCAMPTIHEPAAKEEQVLLSASTDVCESADSAVAHGNSPGGNATFLDQLFCCPITKVVMVDPVIAADGHTYERAAIQHWLQGSSLSPVTKDKLSHIRLFPNVLVKSALAQHAQET